MLRLAVLVSGGGSNLQAIIDSIRQNNIECEIAAVISSKADAYALERAKIAGIKTAVVEYDKNKGQAAFDSKLLELLKKSGADMIVLAGFLRVLSSRIIEKYKNRIVNVHPSLIPSFCGKGYYGLKVHAEALKAGVKITGATVHFVDEGCDSGPIIMQKAVCVKQEDTPESLQKRVMEEAEWILLPKALGLMAEGRVALKDGKAFVREKRLCEF